MADRLDKVFGWLFDGPIYINHIVLELVIKHDQPNFDCALLVSKLSVISSIISLSNRGKSKSSLWCIQSVLQHYFS